MADKVSKFQVQEIELKSQKKKKRRVREGTRRKFEKGVKQTVIPGHKIVTFPNSSSLLRGKTEMGVKGTGPGIHKPWSKS